MSDSSCKRVLPLFCGQSFSPVFPVFFRKVTGMNEFSSFLFCYVGYGLIINFSVFMSKLFVFDKKF